MILQIVEDLRFFYIVLLSVLIGFSKAFWLVSYPRENMSILDSVFNSFMFTLGQNISFEFGSSHIANFRVILLVVFMSFMVILMLNILITLMGESFSKVRGKGEAQWRLEQASIIIDQQFLLSEKITIPPFLHVLKYTSDITFDESCDGSLDIQAKIEEHLKLLKKMHLASLGIVPLTVEDSVEEVMTMIRAQNKEIIALRDIIESKVEIEISSEL